MFKRILVIAAVVVSCGSALASCPELYATGLTLPTGTVELCNKFYVVAYNAGKARPAFVSERLVHGSAVGSVKRLNQFSADARIKNGPTNADYSASGWDRGHLAPAGDASTPEESKASFMLTNMTPQSPTLNRNTWKSLEEKTRSIFSKAKGDVSIVNIPIYPNDPKVMKGRVPIPSGYWKIVMYDGVTRAFYADNLPAAPIKETVLADWKKLIQ
jgi:endonuclease G